MPTCLEAAVWWMCLRSDVGGQSREDTLGFPTQTAMGWASRGTPPLRHLTQAKRSSSQEAWRLTTQPRQMVSVLHEWQRSATLTSQFCLELGWAIAFITEENSLPPSLRAKAAHAQVLRGWLPKLPMSWLLSQPTSVTEDIHAHLSLTP